MIVEYYRPTTLEEALTLLARTEPVTVPLAGGSALNRPSSQALAVVDLQSLGLDTTQQRGNSLDLGATLTLQTLLESADPSSSSSLRLQTALIKAIHHEATYNLRQVASVAGTLVAADGRSPFTTALLALDASLIILPGGDMVNLGDLLPFRTERLRGHLITQVTIPLNAKLAYEYVARSPADRPIVCVALATWPSGRTRLALGGYGPSPLLAFDGTEADGLKIAAESAYSHAGDAWASAEYRQEIAGVLAIRCLEQIRQEDATIDQ